MVTIQSLRASVCGSNSAERFGRVGDSPIIGAGTYADNRTRAVSATGQGEYFIRLGVARDIPALMEYKGISLKDAADFVTMGKLAILGGTGGGIAVDKEGNHTWPFNTSGMYRGYIDADGKVVVEIYKN